jgi:hypothetical protein
MFSLQLVLTQNSKRVQHTRWYLQILKSLHTLGTVWTPDLRERNAWNISSSSRTGLKNRIQTVSVSFRLPFRFAYRVRLTAGMANPRPARFIKHLHKKCNFVPIKYSGTPAQRGIRIINNVIATNCLIRQQDLCSQVLSMNHVTQVVIKTVNYIRSHALPHRQFKEFLEGIGFNGDKNNNNSFCSFRIINTPKLIS